MDANHPSSDAPRTSIRPKQGFRWAILFLASVALIAFDPVVSYLYAPPPGALTEVPEAETTPSTMLELQARYMVALEGLMREQAGDGDGGSREMSDLPLAPKPE